VLRGKEGQQPPGLHQEEFCQQVEGGDPSPLLSTREATTGVLSPVLGSPVCKRHGHTRTRPTKHQKLIKVLEHLAQGERLSNVALLSLEKAWGHTIKVYKYVRVGSNEEGDRLFSVVPCDRKRGKGH